MDLKKLKELCEKATPGPWRIGKSGPNGMPTVGTVGGLMTAHVAHGDNHPTMENAAFIAAAREALPALLSEIEELKRERDLLISAKEVHIIPPAMPESEVITHLQRYIQELAEQVGRQMDVARNYSEIAAEYEDRYYHEQTRAEAAESREKDLAEWAEGRERVIRLMIADLETFRDFENAPGCGQDWFVSRISWHLDQLPKSPLPIPGSAERMREEVRREVIKAIEEAPAPSNAQTYVKWKNFLLAHLRAALEKGGE